MEKPNVLETSLEQSHVLSKTSERGSHRVDMKDAAFVKMRDSVSFYKIDPDEYVLRNHQTWPDLFIPFTDGPCAGGM